MSNPDQPTPSNPNRNLWVRRIGIASALSAIFVASVPLAASETMKFTCPGEGAVCAAATGIDRAAEEAIGKILGGVLPNLVEGPVFDPATPPVS